VEIAPSRRAELACELLSNGRRPSIIYTPTRKQADTLAAELARHFPTAAYHAGLEAEYRERVQEEFLVGRIEVMVATIAFGMGIDKPDVRTVIHTALPGSLEAYYQEIGRAGRDGKPSRATLMHSYADRYTHDFFFERDYPDVAILDKIFAQLGAAPQEKKTLQKRMRMKGDVFDKAVEKLWVHGGAVMDFAENVSVGQPQWRQSYIAHGEQKRAQIDLMIRYAEGNQCRMSGLVRHFGDLADGEAVCGICDFCAPAQCIAQRFRSPTEVERAVVFRIVGALRAGGTKSTGKLHAGMCPNGVMSRDAFEEVLGAMARAGLVGLSDAVFEKDGKQIPYRKVSLTPAAQAVDEQTPITFTIKDLAPALAAGSNKKRGAAPAKQKRSQSSEKAVRQKPVSSDQHAASDARIEAALREWRIVEARRRNIPAFRIFTDRALKAMASRRPRTARDLLAISGIGTTTVEKYGQQIYRIVEDNNRKAIHVENA
jgi:superfamily II DNA helicase RecQ